MAEREKNEENTENGEETAVLFVPSIPSRLPLTSCLPSSRDRRSHENRLDAN